MLGVIAEPSIDVVLSNAGVIETDTNFVRVEFLLENFEFLSIGQFGQVDLLCNNIDIGIIGLHFILV